MKNILNDAKGYALLIWLLLCKGWRLHSVRNVGSLLVKEFGGVEYQLRNVPDAVSLEKAMKGKTEEEREAIAKAHCKRVERFNRRAAR